MSLPAGPCPLGYAIFMEDQMSQCKTPVEYNRIRFNPKEWHHACFLFMLQVAWFKCPTISCCPYVGRQGTDGSNNHCPRALKQTCWLSFKMTRVVRHDFRGATQEETLKAVCLWLSTTTAGKDAQKTLRAAHICPFHLYSKLRAPSSFVFFLCQFYFIQFVKYIF